MASSQRGQALRCALPNARVLVVKGVGYLIRGVASVEASQGHDGACAH